MTKKKLAPARREYPVPFGDGVVRMRSMSGRQLIALQRGGMKEADVLEMTAMAVLHPQEDLGVDDALDLDYDDLMKLLDVWGDVMLKAAVPNSNGES